MTFFFSCLLRFQSPSSPLPSDFTFDQAKAASSAFPFTPSFQLLFRLFHMALLNSSAPNNL